jgi:hypothetical protein
MGCRAGNIGVSQALILSLKLQVPSQNSSLTLDLEFGTL